MTIVVGVDAGEKQDEVVNDGASLADAFDEPLHVVHILSQSRFRKLETTEVEQTGKTIPMETIKEQARQIAESNAQQLDQEYETVGLVGDPKERLPDYAEDENARYLVVGNRKRSPVGKALFGNVMQSVLLNTDIPVVSVSFERES